MARYRRHFVSCLSLLGFHRIACHVFEPETAEGQARAGVRPPVVCVHGLTRNGRDFDVLAGALAETGRRVFCPDVVGRGDSDWLANKQVYGYPQYLADMAALLNWIAGISLPPDSDAPLQVDWVGTSMGGLIGMMLAAQHGHPLRRLVMNDVGPLIPAASLQRLAGYVGKAPLFDDVAAVEAYLRRVHAPFGPLNDAQWRHLATTGSRAVNPADADWPGHAAYRLAYDPGIAAGFSAAVESDVDLWPLWEAVSIPTMVLRGAESDLLLAATAAGMTERGPRARLVKIPGCGHAPALMAEDQVSTIIDWLQVA